MVFIFQFGKTYSLTETYINAKQPIKGLMLMWKVYQETSILTAIGQFFKEIKDSDIII